jgi:hypothetical protein
MESKLLLAIRRISGAVYEETWMETIFGHKKIEIVDIINPVTLLFLLAFSGFVGWLVTEGLPAAWQCWLRVRMTAVQLSKQLMMEALLLNMLVAKRS